MMRNGVTLGTENSSQLASPLLKFTRNPGTSEKRRVKLTQSFAEGKRRSADIAAPAV
jgi:hypothetical protein